MRLTGLPTVLMLTTACVGNEPSTEIADTVYTNGRIYTVNEAHLRVENTWRGRWYSKPKIGPYV